MNINEEYDVEILRENNEGDGVASVNGFIVFVKGALKNEKVKIKIDEVNKNYAVGSIIEIKEKSINRRIPICPYFYDCGGCNLMHMDYNSQLEFKKQKIESIFKKICNIDIKLSSINSYNTQNYRNKVVFKVENDKIGFYKKRTNEIIDINECIITDKKINEVLLKLRGFIKENVNHKIRNVMIRICSDELMISIDNLNNEYKEKFIELFNYVSSIYINNELVHGVESLNQKLNGLVFDVSPKSFFQVNPVTAEKLYNKALSFVSDSDTIVDLYSGTGTITMLLAKKARKVIGIEVVKEAVEDAKNNMLLNHIDNIEFICDKVENKIDTLKETNIDTLIMDPPRGGSDKKTLKSLLEIEPKKIIYISCNPITLARDINVLREKYDIKDVSAFDMFPNTYHVECVCVLNLK